jgi:hypothetical protein
MASLQKGVSISAVGVASATALFFIVVTPFNSILF